MLVVAMFYAACAEPRWRAVSWSRERHVLTYPLLHILRGSPVRIGEMRQPGYWLCRGVGSRTTRLSAYSILLQGTAVAR